MLLNDHFLFLLAGILYALAFLTSLGTGKYRKAFFLFLVPAVAANLAVVALRYRAAWPMLPMHLGAEALPLCLAVMVPLATRTRFPRGTSVQSMVLAMSVVLTCTALCFPMNFYLPFLQSSTLLSHGFLWFGLAGKSCFAVGSAWAFVALGPQPATNRKLPTLAMQYSHRFVALGFALWTLSMFSGELWSYLGWGTPVVWEEPTLTLIMAAWFFYACLLHLHLTRAWSLRARAGYASVGGILVLALTCLPDFGPFRSPF